MSAPLWLLRIGSKEIPLSAGDKRVGRSPDCEIHLDDPLVSRFHATLLVSEDEVRIRDENSRHGVTIGGERITEKALRPNELAVLGQTTFTVVSSGRKRRERMSTLLDAKFPSHEHLEAQEPAAATATNVQEATMAMSVRDLLRHGQHQTAAPLLRQLFQLLSQAERDSEADPPTLRAASRAAIALADKTGDRVWLSEIATVHRVRPRVLAVTTVHLLEELLQRRGWSLPKEFYPYTQKLAGRVMDFDAYERKAFEKLIQLQG